MGPHVTSESEIGGTDSAALRTSRTCLRLCGNYVTSCTSFFRGSDPAIYEAPETTITDSSPYTSVACQSLQVTKTTYFKLNSLPRHMDKTDEYRVNCWKENNSVVHVTKNTHTRLRLTALCLGLPRWASTRKVKTNLDFIESTTVSGSGISWAICKSAPCSRQITMPAPHHSSFLQAGCPSTNSVKALKARC